MPFDAKGLGLFAALVSIAVFQLLIPPSRFMRYLYGSSANSQLRGWRDWRLQWLGVSLVFAVAVGVVVYRAYPGTTMVHVAFIVGAPFLLSGVQALVDHFRSASTDAS